MVLALALTLALTLVLVLALALALAPALAPALALALALALMDSSIPNMNPIIWQGGRGLAVPSTEPLDPQV